LERLNVRCAQVQALDWLSPTPLPFEPQTFDKILLDTPCSNTGVIRRRVDVRWRLTAEEMSRMVTLQRDLLTRILPLLKPDGVLVYSTCSIDEEENQQQIQWLLSNCPTLTCIGELVRTPIQHQSDGAYAAAIQRK
jgi:16S rRNA (cytosine967-C5)-methyltransferase